MRICSLSRFNCFMVIRIEFSAFGFDSGNLAPLEYLKTLVIDSANTHCPRNIRDLQREGIFKTIHYIEKVFDGELFKKTGLLGIFAFALTLVVDKISLGPLPSTKVFVLICPACLKIFLELSQFDTDAFVVTNQLYLFFGSFFFHNRIRSIIQS